MKLSRFIIATRDKDASEEIRWSTRRCPAIEICLGSFTDLPNFDCVATAGNSFGLMDAGMDLAVLKFFGPQVQERIQAHILKEYLGEQPVGTAFLVRSDHPIHPWVVHAPTMRIPMNIAGTDHVYLATWATLLAVHHHNERAANSIETLVCPAFGTGTGGVSAIEAGVQMRLAYEHYLAPPKTINPSFAQLRHESIHYGGRWGFENPRKIQ